MAGTVTLQKTFRYKVYDSTGATYLGELSGVESEPNISWDMNSVGSQLVVTLDKAADSFSEGVLIKFRNRVQVYAIDNEAPTGVLIYQGFISNWTPYYIAGGEKVDITLLSMGFDLSQIVLQNFIANTSYNATTLVTQGGSPQNIAQLITTGPAQTQITGVDLILDDAQASLVNVEFYAVNVATPLVPTSGTDKGGNTSRPTASAPTLFHFDSSASPITVLPNTQYWMVVGIAATSAPINIALNNASNTYSAGKIATYNGAAWTIDTTKALYFVLYPNNGQTQNTFTNTEVGTMLQACMVNYQVQGGVLCYDSSSIIVTTGITPPSVTFNGNTIQDILNQCIALVPNSYWYVDQTQNKLYFQVRAGSAAHKLTLGKDLKSIQLQKYMENVVNTLLFSGGATGGVNLFREYVKQDSVALYGTRTGTLSNSNVTAANAGTADLIAAAYFQANAYPLVRASTEVVDSAGGGYDVELFRPGDMLWIKGSKGSASSLWDVGQWDTDYWDFNLYDLNSMVLQIARITYSPGIAKLDISMVPSQVTAQAQAIQSQVTQVTQAANPGTPTTIYL